MDGGCLLPGGNAILRGVLPAGNVWLRNYRTVKKGRTSDSVKRVFESGLQKSKRRLLNYRKKYIVGAL